MAQDETPIRVLVIDGSRDVRDFIARHVLLPNGYEPILAGNGAEGLRQALAKVPDLILLDYETPKLSSLEVLKALKARPLQIPVILMTSRGSEQVSIQTLRLGVRDYVTKPLLVDDLLHAIQRATFEIHLRWEKATLARQLGGANQHLKQHLTELNILHQVGQAVTELMPLQDLLGRIADAALHVTAAEECFLILNDPAISGPIERVSRKREPGMSFSTSASLQGESTKPSTVAAMLHIPLHIGSRSVGVLGVNNKTTPRAFGDHDKQILRTLASYAAIAIEHARLSQQVKQIEEQETKN
jgi:DNA-binding response OmpR family regulator